MSERTEGNHPHLPSRRAFLRLAGSALVAGFVGQTIGGKPDTMPSDESPFPDLNLSYSRPEISGSCQVDETGLYFITDEAKEIKVFVDQDGLPTKFILQNGCETILDPQKVREARQKAIASTEPELLDIVVIPQKPAKDYDFRYSSKDHPQTLELPGDVLSDGELEQRGVRIIQADSTNLFIRRQAFENGNLLQDFNGRGKKLIITLVDGPAVSANLVKDAKYDEVRRLLKARDADVQNYKTSVLRTDNDVVVLSRQALKDNDAGHPDKYGRNIHEEVILDMKAEIFEFAHLWTEDQITMMMTQSWDGKYAGLYVASSGIKDTEVVFVAVGQGVKEPSRVRLYFDPRGDFKIERAYGNSARMGLAPSVNNNYQDPSKFSLNPDASPQKPGAYPYAGQSTGFALRHELGHHELIINHGDSSEYDTDMFAMQTVRAAWQKWVDSKFTDNSGYYFVFSLPKDSSFKGYILTDALTPSTADPNA